MAASHRSARARESRRACEPIRGVRVRTGFGYGDILYVHIVEGAGSLLPVPGQASSSQSVAGVGFSVRKRASLIYISKAAPTLCIFCGRIRFGCLSGLICKFASWSASGWVGAAVRVQLLDDRKRNNTRVQLLDASILIHANPNPGHARR